MFGPDYTAGCPTCSTIADGFTVHLAHHDITLGAVSRASLAQLQAYKTGWAGASPWRPMAIPGGQLVIYILATAAAGVLARIGPALRAARHADRDHRRITPVIQQRPVFILPSGQAFLAIFAHRG